MRPLVFAFVTSAVTSAVGVAACSQGAPSTQSPDSATSAASGAVTPGASAPTPSAEASTRPAAPTDEFAACKSATGKGASVDITNPPPDGGVVMNNAQTAGDAGGSDRTSKIIDVVMQNRDKFRCCFDLWGKQNPGKEIKIGLSLELKPSGELRSAAFKPDETQLKDPTVEKCMGAVAGSLSFPESPSGKDTTYIHRFVFKSHQ